MNDIYHPNTEICKHCGIVVVKTHAPLRVADACERCKGNGMVDLVNENCGHFTGSVVCDECLGSGRKRNDFLGGPNSETELERIRENDHS